jgi:Tol biopolymer transport system component
LLVPVGTNATEAQADPTWTPDGKSIIFEKSDSVGHIAVYRSDVETGKLFSIPDSDGLSSPRMSGDGHYNEAISITKRYFTSLLSRRSYASLIC